MFFSLFLSLKSIIFFKVKKTKTSTGAKLDNFQAPESLCM